jgi:hypothetical protein
MRLRLLIVIIIIVLPVTLFAKSGSSEAGLFYSTWGTGIQGSYNFTDEILFGGDIASQNTASSGGSSGSTIEAETTIQTVNGFARYYLRDLGVTDGIFGQAGIAFRNWTGTGTITEERTKAKLASINMNWSPLVLVSGVGWHKVWDFGMSTSISYNFSAGGSRTVEYTENMLRFSDAIKSNLEENTDFPTNLVIYIGYSF